MPGDRVDYVGNKTFTDNKGEALSLYGKVGTILSRVQGTENGYSVEFGDDGFVMGGHVLKAHKFTQKELERERNLVKTRRGLDDDD